MADVEFRKCLPGHLGSIRVQDIQKTEQVILLADEYAEIACKHPSFSMWVGNECLGAAGIVPLFPHRAMAWALLSRNIGGYLLHATRKTRQFLELSSIERIEMTVRADYAAGHRWARLLGMELETPEPLKKHGAHGEDEMLYARIK